MVNRIYWSLSQLSSHKRQEYDQGRLLVQPSHTFGLVSLTCMPLDCGRSRRKLRQKQVEHALKV